MTQQINLLGVAARRRTRSPVRAGTLAPALGLLLVFGVGLYAWHRHQATMLDARLAQAVRAAEEAQARQAQLVKEAAARRRDPALEADVARLDTQLAARRANLAALKSGALGDTTGFTAHMRGLARQSLPGVWLTGFSIAGGGQEVSIEGRALAADQVPAYLRRLGAEPAFSGRAFSGLTIRQPKPAGAEDRSAPGWLEFTLAAAAGGATVPESQAAAPAAGAR